MHAQPGSPKKPCGVTYDGRHQWMTWRRRVMCWICGAVRERQSMTYRSQYDVDDFRFARHATVTVLIGIAILIGIVLSCMFGFKAYGRAQAVKDAENAVTTSRIKANNQVRLNEIEISQQKQRVKIEQQKAQIRFEKSKGIREAQDEIAKTLTPLYVQFEMTEALKEIALSGKNSSVIYIPTGTDGLPVVAGVKK